MSKATGVHSVDFKVLASGHGCVNWNGTSKLMGDDGTEVANHSLPKMRGWSNKTGKVKDNGYEYKVGTQDIDMSKNPMYVSQNCIRHHLFKNEMPYHLGKLSAEHACTFLTNPVGLLRGYAITTTPPIWKKSPLLMEDWYDTLHESNFETLSNASSKDSETGGFYSKTTIGRTAYVGYGSINIEELQFISCDGIFGRPAVGIKTTDVQAKALALNITKTLERTALALELNDLSPKAEYGDCWVRNGSIMGVGEAGILLNNDALRVLTKYAETLIDNLYIHQAKGWLRVDSAVFDYNDGVHFRIRDSKSAACASTGEFATYYRSGTENEIKGSKQEKTALSANKKTKATKHGGVVVAPSSKGVI